MIRYDFCIAWNTEEDADFVQLLELACQKEEMTLLKITSENFERTREELVNNQISFRTFFDRGSDNDPRFRFLENWSLQHGVYVFNKSELTARAADKAKMHFVFINAGLQTPYTFLLPSYREQPDIPPIELSQLGESFIIKPAHGGGGEGVVTEANSWTQVLESRKEYPEDTYLLQMYVIPIQLNSRPAWFRVINCTGEIYPCWWDIKTHVYTPVTSSDEETFGLSSLREQSKSIAKICQLELFSSEITLTENNIFIVVDYINDQIDLRLQSKATDGVPDAIIQDIARQLVRLGKNHKSRDSLDELLG